MNNELLTNGSASTPGEDSISDAQDSDSKKSIEDQPIYTVKSNSGPANGHSNYPLLQEDTLYDKGIYNDARNIIQKELSDPKFGSPAKSLDKWTGQLSSQQIFTLSCLLFKRMDNTHLKAIQSLIQQAQNEPAFFFENLTRIESIEKSTQATEETDSLSRLMAAISLSDQPIRKAVTNSYRKSLPVMVDYPTIKSRYESFTTDVSEDGLYSPQSRPLSFSEDLEFPHQSDWNKSVPKTPGLQLSNRIRPKSMYEPGVLNRGWLPEEPIPESGLHLAVGGADTLTWNIPLSPTFHNGRQNGLTPHGQFPSSSYSEDPYNPGNMNNIMMNQEHFKNQNYTNGAPGRKNYHSANPSPAIRAGYLPQNQMQGHPEFSPTNPSTWTNFIDKPKRRSYGDHDLFSQGARNMFSNLPNTFRKHLMKPQNKVDFDLVQDVPAWLRTLRLHKYTDAFDGMVWQDMIKLSDQDLVDKGINALGARRKMLKHFDLVRQELDRKNKVNKSSSRTPTNTPSKS